MDTVAIRRPFWAITAALLLSLGGLAAAEPPARAARLALLSGTVSFSPAGQDEWVRAAMNRPLTTGDRLWTGANSRAEVQIGGAAIRMGPDTSLVLLNLDDRIAQVELSQGTLKLRVRSMGPRQNLEVATPNLAFTLRRIGDYRIEVDPQDNATTVTVAAGEAEVYGEGASYTVTARRGYRFFGNDLADYDVLAAQPEDDLDRWSAERDRRGDNSTSARYVSSEVVGYEDLDANGTWRVDATYGNVWTPRRVAAGWTPYRDGHWSWVDPWGWTWVDDAPWGYAVSHYGRWANIRGSWAWVPGPRQERAVYAPALVAFVGGKNFQVSVSVGGAAAAAVGWFPLAPREVYQPSYPVGRAYFDNINRSNAVIAPQAITNIYNTTIVNNTTTVINQQVYANRLVTGAVVAVPAQAFVQSQPVAKATVRIAPATVASAPVLRVASVAPVAQSVHGGAREAAAKPPARERVVVARTPPPPAALPFAMQQQQLAAKPGMPIEEAQRTRLKPAAPAESAKVSVVAAAPAPTATALPPATPPAARSPEARRAASATRDMAPRESRRPAENTTEAPKADASKGAAARAAAQSAEEAKAAEAKAADARAEAGKAASARAEAVRAEAEKVDKARGEAAAADASKTQAAKAESLRSEAAKTAAAKAEAAKVEAANAEASRVAATQAVAARAEAAKDAANKAEAGKAADARAEATRGARARAEAGKADEAKAEKAQRDAAKAEATKGEAQKAEGERADASKAAFAKAEAAKAEAAKAEANRAEAAKVAAARADTAKVDAAKAEGARAEAAKAGAARAEAAKAEAAKSEAARAEAGKAASARAEAAKAAAAPAPAARPPGARASGPKSEPEADAEDEKQKGRRKP